MDRQARSELSRAADAEAAANNPLIAEALEQWEQEITQAWKTSNLRDVEQRERLRLMLEAAQEFKSHLRRTIETGQLQKAQIERARTRLERVTSWIK